MNQYKSAFHSMYPDIVADKMCEIIDNVSSLHKASDEKDKTRLYLMTRKAFHELERKYYKEIEEWKNEI